jgi:DNA-binding response OmpR family regulator
MMMMDRGSANERSRHLALGVRSARPRVLVVDDDPDLLRLVGMTLEGAGYETVVTQDPLEVIDLLQTTPVDVVVLDVMMPALSGWELLSMLRQNPSTRALPVLMLSALNDAPNRVRGLRGGADDYVGKPFEPEEVAVRVERLLARSRERDVGFEGDLALYPLTDVLDSLVRNQQSGALEVWTDERYGRLDLFKGDPTRAHFGRLLGVEAVRALIEQRQGHYRFQPGTELPAAPGEISHSLSLSGLELEGAWVHDELRRWEEFSPREDASLRVTGRSTEVPSAYARMPLDPVIEYLEQSPSSSLADLLAAELAAPARLRLAVAWLLAAGVLERVGGEEGVGNGRPPGISAPLDRALRRLFEEAKAQGAPAGSAQVVNLVHPMVWSRLAPLLERLPGALLGDNEASMGRRVVAERGGIVRMVYRDQRLFLRFRALPPSLQELVLPRSCSAVVVWTASEVPVDRMSPALRAVANAAGAGVTLLVVDLGSEQHEALAEALGPGSRWRLAGDEATELGELLARLVRQ